MVLYIFFRFLWINSLTRICFYINKQGTRMGSHVSTNIKRDFCPPSFPTSLPLGGMDLPIPNGFSFSHSPPSNISLHGVDLHVWGCSFFPFPLGSNVSKWPLALIQQTKRCVSWLDKAYAQLVKLWRKSVENETTAARLSQYGVGSIKRCCFFRVLLTLIWWAISRSKKRW